MQGMSFCLGLSGWSANDFSRMGQFDLMAPRSDIDSKTAFSIFQALQENWVESASSLSKRLNIDTSLVQAGLGVYAQHGRVLFDMESNKYRVRELSKHPLPMEQLRFANEREARAALFIQTGLVDQQQVENTPSGIILRGTVVDNAQTFQTEITIDSDLRQTGGHCGCHFYHHNQLRQGPCEHMLAIRLLQNQRQSSHSIP